MWSKFNIIHDEIDILCGGPPCQGFSTANRQRLIDDPRNKLYKEFIKSVNVFKPKLTLMENVSGIFNKREEIFNDFSKIGYNGICLKLNAADFNIPQRRNRVFFIMYNNRKIEDNLKNFTDFISSSIESKKVNSNFKLSDAIFDLPKLEAKDIKNSTELENQRFGFSKKKIEKNLQNM